MDFQNRVGSRFGRGSGISASESNVDRRDRLKKLAMETIDLASDPYFLKNYLGSFECKLCLTIHTNEGSYLAHTQGKKHQTNLQRRAAKDSKDMNVAPIAGVTVQNRAAIHKVAIKIGRPGYKVTKVRDAITLQNGLLFSIYYPDIRQGVKPRHRFMSSYEQRIDPPTKYYQYVLFAAEPYETIAFKIQSLEIERAPGKFWTYWDPDSAQFHIQFFFKHSKEEN